MEKLALALAGVGLTVLGWVARHLFAAGKVWQAATELREQVEHMEKQVEEIETAHAVEFRAADVRLRNLEEEHRQNVATLAHLREQMRQGERRVSEALQEMNANQKEIFQTLRGMAEDMGEMKASLKYVSPRSCPLPERRETP